MYTSSIEDSNDRNEISGQALIHFISQCKILEEHERDVETHHSENI